MCLRAKNKALQLQRVPILSILGYITLTYSLNRLSSLKFPKPKMKGRQIWPPPRAAKGPATPLNTVVLQREYREFRNVHSKDKDFKAITRRYRDGKAV